jgi:predicted O-methyltransferase YrrM
LQELDFTQHPAYAVDAKILSSGSSIDGNVSPYELEILSKMVAWKQPKTIFEFGTFNGLTTLNMAANLTDGGVLYTLDLPASEMNNTVFPVEGHEQFYVQKPIIGAHYKKSEYKDKVVQLLGDSATFDYTPYIGKMDFIFVDAGHAFPNVANDSYWAYRLVAPGGIIFWHDFMSVWTGVMHAIKLMDTLWGGLNHITDATLVFKNN